MAVNIAERASDGRRAKNRHQASRQLTWVEELQNQINARPGAFYEIEEMVLTPIGMKRIVDRHYRARGWHYSFWTPVGRYTFSEKQLLPYGDCLLLQDIMKRIGAGG